MDRTFQSGVTMNFLNIISHVGYFNLTSSSSSSTFTCTNLSKYGYFFHLISVTKSFISVCWILLLKRALSRTYFIHSSFLSSNRTIRVGTLVSNWAFFTDNVVCFTFILFLIRRSLGQNSSSFRLLLQYLLSSNQRLSLLSRFIFIIKPTTFILYPRFCLFVCFF